MVSRGFLGSCLILLGGLGTAVLPESSAVMRWHVVPAIRGAESGRVIAWAIVFAGLVLVTQQWLALVRHSARAEHDGPGGAAALALVRQCALVWSLPLVIAPPLFSRDGWSYAAQGMLERLGISPYEHGTALLTGPIVEAVDPRWMDSITPYGPLPVFFGEIGAGITSNPWVLVIGHRLLALVGLVLLAWAVPRLARWTGVNPALASAIVLISPLMLCNGVGGLHNDLLMVGLMASALVVAVERGWAYGAVLGGLAASVKAPGGVICVAVVLVTLPLAATLKERLGRLAGVGATAVATLFGLGVVTGVGDGWTKALSVPGTVPTPLSITTWLGTWLDWAFGILPLGVPSHTFLDLVRNLGTLAAVALTGWVVLRWKTGDRAAALQAACLVVAATVILSPVVHLWYLLWIPPFLATLRLDRVASAGVLAASILFGFGAVIDSVQHGVFVVIALVALATAAAVLVALRRPSSRERIERITDSEWIPV